MSYKQNTWKIIGLAVMILGGMFGAGYLAYASTSTWTQAGDANSGKDALVTANGGSASLAVQSASVTHTTYNDFYKGGGGRGMVIIPINLLQ